MKSFLDLNMQIWIMNSNKGISLYTAFPKYFDHKTLLALRFGKVVLQFIVPVTDCKKINTNRI